MLWDYFSRKTSAFQEATKVLEISPKIYCLFIEFTLTRAFEKAENYHVVKHVFEMSRGQKYHVVENMCLGLTEKLDFVRRRRRLRRRREWEFGRRGRVRRATRRILESKKDKIKYGHVSRHSLPYFEEGG